MKQPFIKINPYLFEDKNNIRDKMAHLCCQGFTDNHTFSLSYHKQNVNMFILTLFHKGGFVFNIKYNFKTKKITSKTTCHCVKDDLDCFINDNQKVIKYHFRTEIKPYFNAIQESKVWKPKKQILDEYLYSDIINLVKGYLCYERKCIDCKKSVKGTYDRCYGCHVKSTQGY